MRSPLLSAAVLLTTALVATGCGGSSPKTIADIEGCLKVAKLKTERAAKGDARVEEGVTGTADAEEQKDFVLAIAARTKTQKDLDEFEKQTKEFTKQVESSDASKGKLEIESGTEGKYVWVVAGGEKGATYDKAKACVQP